MYGCPRFPTETSYFGPRPAVTVKNVKKSSCRRGMVGAAILLPLHLDAHQHIAPLDPRRDRPTCFGQRQPRRDAREHRQRHSAAIRYRRLLGLSARARSYDACVGRHYRAASGEHRPDQDANHRRTGRSGGGTDAPDRRAGCHAAPSLQVFSRGRRGFVPHVLWRAGRRSGRSSGRPRGADRRVARIRR